VESSCELGNEPSGSINAGNCRVAAQLVASRVVLSCTELVCFRQGSYGHGLCIYGRLGESRSTTVYTEMLIRTVQIGHHSI
jgi:hypothetical protein